MTREEVTKHLNILLANRCWHCRYELVGNKVCDEKCVFKHTVDEAIEALSQPIVAKHFDIQSGYIYCSPQIAENVKVVVRCKDCKYFELDHFDRIDDMPIITAHEICTKWSGGSKTSKDGFCFMGERRKP